MQNLCGEHSADGYFGVLAIWLMRITFLQSQTLHSPQVYSVTGCVLGEDPSRETLKDTIWLKIHVGVDDQCVTLSLAGQASSPKSHVMASASGTKARTGRGTGECDIFSPISQFDQGLSLSRLSRWQTRQFCLMS